MMKRSLFTIGSVRPESKALVEWEAWGYVVLNKDLFSKDTPS